MTLNDNARIFALLATTESDSLVNKAKKVELLLRQKLNEAKANLDKLKNDAQATIEQAQLEVEIATQDENNFSPVDTAEEFVAQIQYKNSKLKAAKANLEYKEKFLAKTIETAEADFAELQANYDKLFVA